MGDLFDAAARVFVIPRLPFLKLIDQAAVIDQGFFEVLLSFGGAAFFTDDDIAVTRQPVGVLEQGVVVPVGSLARLERFLEGVCGAAHVVPSPLVAGAQRKQVVGAVPVFVFHRDFQQVLDHVHRQLVAVVAVDIPAVAPGG